MHVFQHYYLKVFQNISWRHVVLVLACLPYEIKYTYTYKSNIKNVS